MTRSPLAVGAWFAAVSLFTIGSAPAQPCASGGTTSTVITGYNVSTSPNTWVSILGNPGTIPIFIAPPIDDATSTTQLMPFPFPSWVPIVNGWQVNSNGWIAFDQNLAGPFFFNQPLPSSVAPNHALFPWWHDTIIPSTSTGSIQYLIAGTAPNQTITFEFDQLEDWVAANVGNGDPVSYQVVLHEGTGIVDFHYLAGGGSGNHTASVGFENHTGGVGADLTGLGDANNFVPATDFTMTPSGFTTIGGGTIPSYTLTTLPPAYSSITGLPGENILWLALSPTGTECGGCNIAPDDDNTFSTLLPFPFTYFNTATTEFAVDTNGHLSLNGGGCGAYISAPPGTPAASSVIGPFWDDLSHMAPTSRTSYLVTGPPGNQQMIVQWEDLTVWYSPGPNCSDPGGRVRFQAILHQGTNNIEFRYGGEVPNNATPTPAGWVASVGITDATGAYGVDATGLGTGNTTLPVNNFLFDPCEPCGTSSTFGPGCGPLIGAAGGAAISPNPFYAITESGAPPGSIALLYLGASTTTLFGLIPLPAPIALFGFGGGCSILIDLNVFMGTTIVNGAGNASMPAPIPGGIPPCSGPIYAQYFNAVPGGGGVSVIASNALSVITG